MKNILVLTGSPRELGNSALLANAFMEGAKENGHRVKVFETAFHPIEPCKACDKCWSGGKPCVFKDGFADLAPLLEQAEILVFATPLYWFSMSAQIKSAIDKLYAYMKPEAKNKLKIEACVLLASAEGCEKDGDYDGLKATYKSIINYLNLKDLGMVLAGHIGQKGAILQSEYLKAAKELGRSIKG